MAIVKTRVTLALEVDVGCFGDDWHIDSLKRDAKRALDTALGHLTATALKSGIKIVNVETKGLIVVFDEKD